jgi:signal transduction histidine kinase
MPENNLSVTIVMVEDDPGHARLIEKNLRRAHIANDIVVLRDGQEAVAYFFPVVEVAEEVPLVLGVADQLEQVCLNVLVNAWHAMPTGGTVTIRAATPDAQHVQLTFQDTGCGMAPEALARAR